MTTLFFLALCSSFAITGFHYCIQYNPVYKTGRPSQNAYGEAASHKEIFWFYKFYLGQFLHRYLPWLEKPLVQCMVCMSGPYGTIAFFSYWFFHQSLPIWYLAPFLLMLAGMQRTMLNIIRP